MDLILHKFLNVLCVHGVLVYCITFVIHGTLILTELIQLVLYWKIQTNKQKKKHYIENTAWVVC